MEKDFVNYIKGLLPNFAFNVKMNLNDLTKYYCL